MCNTDTGTGISLSVRYIISVTGVLYDNNVLLRALFVLRNEYRSFFFQENRVEIWCGQSQGAMAIFSLTDSVVTSQDIVHHTLGKEDGFNPLAIICHNFLLFSYMARPVERLLLSFVFQNIDPPPPSPPGECVPPAFVAGGGHTRRVERGVGVNSL
jgi:hypothetical protein